LAQSDDEGCEEVARRERRTTERLRARSLGLNQLSNHPSEREGPITMYSSRTFVAMLNS